MYFIIAIFGLAATLGAQDFAGIWMGQIAGRNGQFQEVEFRFIQNGSALTGKLYGDYRSTPIAEGKVTGDQISFLVVAQEQSGNQINDTRHQFTGVLKDGEIEITRERQSSTTAGNGGGVQFRGNPKITFRLKRLF